MVPSFIHLLLNLDDLLVACFGVLHCGFDVATSHRRRRPGRVKDPEPLSKLLLCKENGNCGLKTLLQEPGYYSADHKGRDTDGDGLDLKATKTNISRVWSNSIEVR